MDEKPSAGAGQNEEARYEVIVTPEAEADLTAIYAYVSSNLAAPQSGRRYVTAIKKAVLNLNIMPYRHQIYPREPWRSRKARYLSVGSYTIFYYPEPASKRVYVFRITWAAS